MLAVTTRWADISKHERFGITHERVAQHLGKIATSKRCVTLSLVLRPDALLQRQQGLVDLSTIYTGLFVCVNGIGTTLTAC